MATTGADLIFAMATIPAFASGCSGCDKESGSAVDGGGRTAMIPDAGRLAILRSPAVAPLGPAIEIAETDHD